MDCSKTVLRCEHFARKLTGSGPKLYKASRIYSDRVFAGPRKAKVLRDPAIADPFSAAGVRNSLILDRMRSCGAGHCYLFY